MLRAFVLFMAVAFSVSVTAASIPVGPKGIKIGQSKKTVGELLKKSFLVSDAVVTDQTCSDLSGIIDERCFIINFDNNSVTYANEPVLMVGSLFSRKKLVMFSIYLNHGLVGDPEPEARLLFRKVGSKIQNIYGQSDFKDHDNIFWRDGKAGVFLRLWLSPTSEPGHLEVRLDYVDEAIQKKFMKHQGRSIVRGSDMLP